MFFALNPARAFFNVSKDYKYEDVRKIQVLISIFDVNMAHLIIGNKFLVYID